jgi:hypothetical protein
VRCKHSSARHTSPSARSTQSSHANIATTRAYEEEIRRLLESNPLHVALSIDKPKQMQILSCLDAIGDTELAIGSYPPAWPSRPNGMSYLMTYGILQALVLQQDAVFHLCEYLGIPEKRDSYPRLKEIREIRNDSIGHPTQRGGGSAVSYHALIRMSLTHDGFTLLSHRRDGTGGTKEISVSPLIAAQRKAVSQILATAAGSLQNLLREHKQTFREKKIASIFTPVSYAFENLDRGLFEHRFGNQSAEWAQTSIAIIGGTVAKFKDALKQRSETLDLEDECLKLDHTLGKLQEFCTNIKQGVALGETELTARVFVYAARRLLEEFAGFAKEIDSKYEH